MKSFTFIFPIDGSGILYCITSSTKINFYQVTDGLLIKKDTFFFLSHSPVAEHHPVDSLPNSLLIAGLHSCVHPVFLGLLFFLSLWALICFSALPITIILQITFFQCSVLDANFSHGVCRHANFQILYL